MISILGFDDATEKTIYYLWKMQGYPPKTTVLYSDWLKIRLGPTQTSLFDFMILDWFWKFNTTWFDSFQELTQMSQSHTDRFLMLLVGESELFD